MVDAESWDRRRPPRPAPPHLDALQDAVVDGVQVQLGYVARDGAGTSRSSPTRSTASVRPSWSKRSPTPGKVGLLRMLLGVRVRIGPPGPDGRVEVEIRGHGPEAVAADIAGLGSWVEVLDPPSVRHRLAALAGELASLYATRGLP